MTSVIRNQDNLRRTISTSQAVGIAFNQVVGGGVVSLTGVAIALTGGGTPIAYLMAALSIIIVSIPYAAIGSAMPVTGGGYTYLSRFVHPFAGYLNMCFSTLSQTSMALYGVVAGQYMHSLNPWFDPTTVALSMISFFYVANMLGAVIGARLSTIMMLLHIAGFAVFIVYGFWNFDWVHYPPLLPNGLLKLFQAAAILTFASGGALTVIELGGELKHPGRAIPMAIFGGTLLAAALYVAIAIVAAGILPIPQVANQPLSVVAAYFLPPAALQFFILGGAIIAVIGSTNSQLLAGSKSLLAAVDDGWFPKRLGSVNRRFGTPHFLLTLLYVVGVVPVLFHIPLEMIASAVSAMIQMMFSLVIIAALRFRYLRPDLHDAAPFKLNLGVQWLLSILGIGVCCIQTFLLLSEGAFGKLLPIFLTASAVMIAWGAIRYAHVRRTATLFADDRPQTRGISPSGPDVEAVASI